jgi:hypothetical protein
MQTRLILCDIEAPRSHLINTELAAEDQVSGGLSPQKEREDGTRGARRVGPIFVPFVRLLLAIVVGGGSEFRRPSNLLEYLQRPAEPALDVGYPIAVAKVPAELPEFARTFSKNIHLEAAPIGKLPSNGWQLSG